MADKKERKLWINDLYFQDNVMFIHWSYEGCGFGVLTVHQNDTRNLIEKIENEKDEPEVKFSIETECMGETFAKKVLEKAAEYIMSNKEIIE